MQSVARRSSRRWAASCNELFRGQRSTGSSDRARLAAAAGAAAVFASLATPPLLERQQGYVQPITRSVRAESVADVAKQVEGLVPAGAKEIPCAQMAKEMRKDGTGMTLIFHTLYGPGKIQAAKMWRIDRPTTRDGLADDEEPGHTEVWLLMELGDQICGHPEYIHGGFLSAIFDEMFGWCVNMEREVLPDRGSRIFTANLSIDYRRPVSKNNTYLLKCRICKVVRNKKVYLDGAIESLSGQTLTEGKSLYVLTGLSQASRNRKQPTSE
mmetsp:Transcript_74508/g.155319  ORF Transcript_74508/g.155319 Transcript_74508/m.155319 type:complete len:269 (-) Transcript_74508:46-852(-)